MTPDSMLHKVLGQKDFPSSGFFVAGLSSMPSFTWRSLLVTWDILVAGLRWKVGDGQDIPIIAHLWLPRPQTFQLVAHPNSLPADTRVADLIAEGKERNYGLITAEFQPLDTECIFGIKL
ncbi:UNVERIFIED_CONTAM: hypothetical protein Sradi_0198600 [Sesamum radiatum]|uniref:Uncharacterized protein n=1 Tax=Sesamum radiatum TaxID=300843 RepID=A0AAW2VZ99_SESRA